LVLKDVTLPPSFACRPLHSPDSHPFPALRAQALSPTFLFPIPKKRRTSMDLFQQSSKSRQKPFFLDPPLLYLPSPRFPTFFFPCSSFEIPFAFLTCSPRWFLVLYFLFSLQAAQISVEIISTPPPCFPVRRKNDGPCFLFFTCFSSFVFEHTWFSPLFLVFALVCDPSSKPSCCSPPFLPLPPPQPRAGFPSFCVLSF